LEDISVLSNWTLHQQFDYKVYAEYAFANTRITDISPLYTWDLSKLSLTLAFARMIIPFWDATQFVNTQSTIYLTGTFYQSSMMEICDLGDKCSQIYLYNQHTSSTIYHRGSFQGCTKLHTLIIRTNSLVPVYGYDSGTSYLQNMFSGTVLKSSSGKLYVPSALVSLYTNNSNWQIALLNSGCQVLPLEGSIYEQPGSVTNLYS
jgi:hypothetical protein